MSAKNPLFDLTGRTALITGSSQGIGLALACGLAQAGAAVVLNGRDAAKLSAAADTVRTMVAVLGEDFQGEIVRVVLFKPVAGLEAEWLQVVAEQDAALAPFRDFIAGNEPICGRLNQDKLALLYGDQQARAASAVLLPLPGVGMLSVGSSDANRFFPGMGTLFLRLMSEALVTALGRYAHA